MTALKSANKELKGMMKTVKIQDIDNLQDEMMDLMDVSNEIQETLGRSYNVPDDIDEEDLMGELDALEADMGLETEADGVPSYLQPDKESDLDAELHLPSAPIRQAAAPAGRSNAQDYFWSGGRKDGRDGSFNPRSRELSAAPFVENFMGLPIRPGERDCPYYMRNLSCGYGLSCRFNHPDPTPAGDSEPPSGYGNGGPASLQGASSSTAARWSAPRSLNNAPHIIPPSEGIPSRNTEHNGYQANASFAQKEVHTKGGAVRVRGRGCRRGIANEAPAVAKEVATFSQQSVARGIRGCPRSMLRDMRRGLARGTGRANVAPAVATEVATSSQQSLVRGEGRGLPRTMIRGLARGRANIPLSQSTAPTQESSNPSSTSVTAQPGSIFKLPAIRGGTFKWATIKGGTFKRTTIRGGTFKRPTEVLSQP